VVRTGRVPEEELAPIWEDRAALRALAADKLADFVLADPDATWARFALKASSSNRRMHCERNDLPTISPPICIFGGIEIGRYCLKMCEHRNLI